MSKFIRVSEKTWSRLAAHRDKTESFGEVVERALNVLDTIEELRGRLPASHYLQERPGKEVITQ